MNNKVVLTAEVIYSSHKIALETARDGEKNIAWVAGAWKLMGAGKNAPRSFSRQEPVRAITSKQAKKT